jgi:hypothetical protein
MIPGLLLPAALGALAALLIPLLVHVARRTETREVVFAALRWLAPKARPRSRPRLDERMLLTVRLLLLAVLALCLARPVLWGAQDGRGVVAVAPGLDAPAFATDGDDRRTVWLAPGFPPASGEAPQGRADLVSLLRQLDAELPAGAALEVVVPAVLDGVDAERPRLSRAVAWRVVSDPPPPAAARPPAPPRLVVRYAPDAAERVRWFRAAAIAWAEPGAAPAFEAETVERPIPAGARHLIWLAPGPAPDALAAWARGGGTVLLAHDATLSKAAEPAPVWRDAAGAPPATARAFGRGRVVHLTRPLQPASLPALVEADFPDALQRLLQPPPPPARVRAVDHAPTAGVVAASERPFRDLGPGFALLAALLFLAERWLATRARPAALP